MVKKKVTILDYGCGNLFSLARILEKSCNIEISNDPKIIEKSDKIILPGVGSFKVGIKNLNEKNLDESLRLFLKKGNYLLGICLGMQLLMDESFEFGHNKGLGLINGSVKKINFQKSYPVPNIGWRRVYSNNGNRRNPLFHNIIENSYFYFIHSYKVETKKKEESISQAQYGNEIICSVINNNNIYGTQFHPEKSSRQGETMIQNFLNF